jgi:CubicO group peptidase (beta-lactamase class C family)
MLVAACVVEHVVAGRLALDDPVRRLVPAFRPVDGGITVRQLLHHTSGLDAADDLRDTGDDDGAIRRYVLADHGTTCRSGTTSSAPTPPAAPASSSRPGSTAASTPDPARGHAAISVVAGRRAA